MYQGMAKGRGKYTPMCLGMVFRVEENIHPKVDVDASMGEFWSSEFFSACLREGGGGERERRGRVSEWPGGGFDYGSPKASLKFCYKETCRFI